MVRGATGLSRKKDKIYRVNLCGLIPYLVIPVLTTKFRIDKMDNEGRCIIGIERQTTILILGYDFAINVDPFECLMILDIPYNSVSSPYSGIIFLFSSF